MDHQSAPQESSSEHPSHRAGDFSHWGVFAHFAEATANGSLDGFFVPLEYQYKVPAHTSLVQYKSTGGSLYFTAGAWAAYGYASEADFALDVKESRVAARTLIGALGLGPVRLRTSPDNYVISCFVPNLAVKLTFYPETQTEAKEGQEVLESLLPGCEVCLTEGGQNPFWAGVPKGLLSSLAQWKELPLEKKAQLRVLAVIATAPALLALGMLVRVPSWATTAAGALFIFAFTLMSRGFQNGGPESR